ncbi:MAG: S8 family peptidase [Leptothrix sp. (in: b-proteobacteria)]
MPATLRIVATLLCALIAGPLLAQTGEHARVIVKYRSGMVTAQSVRDGQPTQGQRTRTLASRHNLPLEAGTTIADRTSVVQASGISSAELASRLAADPDVEMTVVDERRRAHAAPGDPLYPSGLTLTSPAAGQWYLHAPTTLLRSPIDIEAAWAVTHGSSGVVVAMLDSGVRHDHPDLTGKLLPGRDFVSNAETANDGDGWDTDPSDPGDWVTEAEANNPKSQFYQCTTYNSLTKRYEAQDSMWHGTQTAGLVGAMTNNGIGMAGAGRNVMVLPVRVLGKCGGYDSDIIAAMRWAAGLTVLDSQGQALPINPYPARVINLSLGSPPSTSTDSCAIYNPVISELTRLGVVIVASAGNDGQAVHAPGNCSGVIAVASLNRIGTKATYSSLGPQVTVSTPGGDDVLVGGTYQYPVLSTSNSGVQLPGASIYTGGGSNATIGTSFSAPLVSGTIGLMLSANPDLSASQVRSLIMSSARSFPTSGAISGIAVCSASTAIEQKECYCSTATCGAGMLDAGAAVTAAAAGVPVVDLLASSATPSVGSLLTVTGATSHVPAGRSITNYAWSVTSGADQVSIISSVNDSLTVQVLNAGTFTLRLVITDSSGASASASQTFNLKTVPASATTSGGSSSSTSDNTGGGALDARWLIGLAAAVLALARRRRWSGG